MSVIFSDYQRAQRKSIQQLFGWMSIVFLVIIGSFILIYRYTYTSAISREKRVLHQTIDISLDCIQPIRDQVISGEITPEQGLAEIADSVRRMTYNDSYGENYVFLVDNDGVIVVNPYLPDREGTNQWDMQDTKGKYIVRNLVDSAKKHPDGGYVTYYYLPPNGTEEDEKLTYVVALPEVNALIGTGLYLSSFTASLTRFNTIIILISVALLLMLSYPITLSVRKLREAARQIEAESNERKIAESDTLTVFEGSRDALFIMEMNGDILMINPAMVKLFGLPAAQIIGHCLTEIISDDETDNEILQLIHNNADQPDLPSFEWQFTRLFDKQKLTVDVSAARVNWSGKREIFISIRDVTDREKLVQEINRNNLLLEKAQKLAHVGHFYYDLITKDITWSKEMYQIAQLPFTEKAPGLIFQQDLIIKDGWNKILAAREQITATRVPVSFDIQIKLANDTIRDISITMEPVNDPSNKLIAIAGAVQDVTERNITQQALIVSESRFLTAIENIPYEVWAIDEDGKYVIQNMISQKTWGDLKGKLPAEGSLPPDFARQFEQNNRRVLRGELINEEFSRFIQGRRSDLLLVYSPIKDGDTILGGFGINIDLTDQKAAQDQVVLELNKIEMLREIDKRIIGRLDAKNTFDFICQSLISLIKAEAVSIHLYNPEKDLIEPLASSGFNFLASACLNGKKKNSLCWNVLRSQAIITDAAPKFVEGFKHCPCIMEGGFRGYIGLPITSDTGPRGVLELHFSEKQDLSSDWVNFLVTVAGQAAIVLDNTFLYSQLEQTNHDLESAYEATITGWSHALELRDKETKGHSERVMRMALDLAREMGVPEPDLVHFKRGVLLHDIGKMGIPDSILLKPAALTEDEWVIMRKHPQYAYDLLKNISYLKPALDIPHYHHERWDGSGYPAGMKAENIPLSARIFAVVDVWDALISDRPYRPGWSREEVITYMRQNAGVLFDAQIVDRLLLLVTTPGYLEDQQ